MVFVDVVIIGAGIAGVAAASSLVRRGLRCLLVDERPPMSFTSAQSGENYRNWWPHPTMVRFSEASIALMRELQVRSNSAFDMSCGGYVLATRSEDIGVLIQDLESSLGKQKFESEVRFHTPGGPDSYRTGGEWGAELPFGIDVFSCPRRIKEHFPYLGSQVRRVLHIRHAGTVDSQAMAGFMLHELKTLGGRQLRGRVCAIDAGKRHRVLVSTNEGTQTIESTAIVNAAGPFLNDIAALVGDSLPVQNVYQQKIALRDTRSVIPRSMPFAIDLDTGLLPFDEADRRALAQDENLRWVSEPLPGGTHIRPEGGDNSSWLKLGWAYNAEPSQEADPDNDPHRDDAFPELVLRGIQRLMPSMGVYVDDMPGGWLHYGGYYTMTEENWPIVGPTAVPGVYAAGALSGFGTMAACAAGDLVARWVAGATLPGYAGELSMARYEDPALLASLRQGDNRGIL